MLKISRPPMNVEGGSALHVRMGLHGVRLAEWHSIKGHIRRLIPDYLEPGKVLTKQHPDAVQQLIDTICDKFSDFGFQQYQNAWPVRDYIACYCRSRVKSALLRDRPCVWPKHLRLPPMPSPPNSTETTRDVNYEAASQCAPSLSDDDNMAFNNRESVHEPDPDTVSVIDLCSDDPPGMPHPPVRLIAVKTEQEQVKLPEIAARKGAPKTLYRSAGTAAVASQSRKPSRTPYDEVRSSPSHCIGTSRTRGGDDVAHFLGSRPRPLLHLLPFLRGLGIKNKDDLAELACMEEHTAWLDDAAEKHNGAARPAATMVSPFDLLRLKTVISALKEETGKETLLIV